MFPSQFNGQKIILLTSAFSFVKFIFLSRFIGTDVFLFVSLADKNSSFYFSFFFCSFSCSDLLIPVAFVKKSNNEASFCMYQNLLNWNRFLVLQHSCIPTSHRFNNVHYLKVHQLKGAWLVLMPRIQLIMTSNFGSQIVCSLWYYMVFLSSSTQIAGYRHSLGNASLPIEIKLNVKLFRCLVNYETPPTYGGVEV
jgi:hypothetical protein